MHSFIVFYIASGKAFFTGTVIIILGCILSLFFKNRRIKLILNISICIGIAAVILSATPLPIWFYYSWIGLTIFWQVFNGLGNRYFPKVVFALCILVLLCSLSAFVSEYLHHKVLPEPLFISDGKYELFYVIGDSISAGIGDEKERLWTDIIAETHKIRVINLAQAGADVKSASAQAEKVQTQKALILLEIGGNDLLYKTPAKEFEIELDKLLKSVKRQHNNIVMLELPLLPFADKYGRIQRTLAKKYGVALIPKRIFVKILSDTDATVDGIHLSAKGHKLMAEMIWDIIGNCLCIPVE